MKKLLLLCLYVHTSLASASSLYCERYTIPQMIYLSGNYTPSYWSQYPNALRAGYSTFTTSTAYTNSKSGVLRVVNNTAGDVRGYVRVASSDTYALLPQLDAKDIKWTSEQGPFTVPKGATMQFDLTLPIGNKKNLMVLWDAYYNYSVTSGNDHGSLTMSAWFANSTNTQNAPTITRQLNGDKETDSFTFTKQDMGNQRESLDVEKHIWYDDSRSTHTGTVHPITFTNTAATAPGILLSAYDANGGATVAAARGQSFVLKNPQTTLLGMYLQKAAGEPGEKKIYGTMQWTCP
ncbi:hypothetical protein D5952_14220 [Salmonella enterica subsp. enterica]|nr:hypothetical protein [Salmonella enterica subsp. enterica serovar Bonn]MLZ41080.1 hypothetical protein [Salmonella enterica subsp. enterica serovar Bonn]